MTMNHRAGTMFVTGRSQAGMLLIGKIIPESSAVGIIVPISAPSIAARCEVVRAATSTPSESVLYTIVSLSLGVLVAARTTSQRAAMLGALVGTMMPTALLSGMIFPISSMPAWLRPLTNLVPARWFIVIARGIMLKGAGIGYLWLETLVLAGMALLLLTAATRSFHERLD